MSIQNTVTNENNANHVLKKSTQTINNSNISLRAFSDAKKTKTEVVVLIIQQCYANKDVCKMYAVYSVYFLQSTLILPAAKSSLHQDVKYHLPKRTNEGLLTL